MLPEPHPVTWVVVAESSRGRIFRCTTARGPLEEVETLAHPESRLHGRDLDADRPGRVFDSAGTGRHAVGKEVGPKDKKTLDFATRIARRLEAGRTARAFDRLVIVAPPAFLGLLRGKLSDATRKLVTHEISGNLVQLDAAGLRDALPDRL